jgi:glycosyltransferase involved in cell wall biosynthesis
VNDLRWFAPNQYTRLVASELRKHGLVIALEGSEPARVALSMSGTTAQSAWQYSRTFGCPLVLYIWDLPPAGTASGSYDPVWAIRRSLIRIPRFSGAFARRAGYYSKLRYIAHKAAEVWAPSSMTVGLLKSRFDLDSRQVPYCYDSARFMPANTPRDSPPTLLTVGRLKRHKNQEATLRVAHRLGEEVQVRLIGMGPQAEPLEQMARSLGVKCRVDTGATDFAVVDACRRARVAICPSRFEGFGLAPLEAIACGTPVVASDIPPHREFVGTAARLFPLDDDNALEAAVRGALNNEAPDPAGLESLTIPAAAERFRSRLRTLF